MSSPLIASPPAPVPVTALDLLFGPPVVGPGTDSDSKPSAVRQTPEERVVDDTLAFLQTSRAAYDAQLAQLPTLFGPKHNGGTWDELACRGVGVVTGALAFCMILEVLLVHPTSYQSSISPAFIGSLLACIGACVVSMMIAYVAHWVRRLCVALDLATTQGAWSLDLSALAVLSTRLTRFVSGPEGAAAVARYDYLMNVYRESVGRNLWSLFTNDKRSLSSRQRWILGDHDWRYALECNVKAWAARGDVVELSPMCAYWKQANHADRVQMAALHLLKRHHDTNYM